MVDRIAGVVARRYLAAGGVVPYSEGDVVEHEDGRVKRIVYVVSAHGTGGNYPSALNGRVIWSTADDAGIYVDLDDRGIVANRGKAGGAERAEKAFTDRKIKDYLDAARARNWYGKLDGDALVVRYSPNAFSSHLQLTITVAEWRALVDEAGPVKCRLLFEKKSSGVKIKKTYTAKTAGDFKKILGAAEVIFLEHYTD